MSNKVTKIESLSFDNCASLKSITVTNRVKTINGYAFNNCKNLKKISVPKSVKKIGKKAFGYKEKGVRDIKIKGFTIKGYKGTAAEKYAKKNKFKFVELD